MYVLVFRRPKPTAKSADGVFRTAAASLGASVGVGSVWLPRQGVFGTGATPFVFVFSGRV